MKKIILTLIIFMFSFQVLEASPIPAFYVCIMRRKPNSSITIDERDPSTSSVIKTYRIYNTSIDERDPSTSSVIKTYRIYGI